MFSLQKKKEVLASRSESNGSTNCAKNVSTLSCFCEGIFCIKNLEWKWNKILTGRDETYARPILMLDQSAVNIQRQYLIDFSAVYFPITCDADPTDFFSEMFFLFRFTEMKWILSDSRKNQVFLWFFSCFFESLKYR